MSKVVLLMGISGSGKSEIARYIKERLGWCLLSRDHIRASMFDPCLYTEIEKVAAYGALKNALCVIINQKRHCVIDGMSFSRTGEFEEVKEIVVTRGAKLIPIFCHIPVDVAVHRVNADQAQGKHIAQNRDESLVRQMALRFRKIPDEIIVVNTNKTKRAVFAEVMREIRRSRSKD